MKKIIIFALGILCSVASFAQTATLESAQEFVKTNDLTNAKKAIDEVTTGKEDKNASAWFTKGFIYQKISEDVKLRGGTPNANVLALEAYKKFIALEKKLDISLVKDNMLALLGNFFNSAISAYNDKKYAEAISQFDHVLDVKNSDVNGKILGTDKMVDTIIAQSKMYKGYSYYNDKKSSDAAPLFEEAITNPITKDVDIYLRLASIYQNDADNVKWIGTIQKGITAYPNNNDLKNEEINYFLLTNKQDELIKKLEEATVRDPKNAQTFFSLATSYDQMMKEKSNSDNSVIAKKTITTYEKAISLDAKNGDYVYNLGALYFNQAVEINDDINRNKDNKIKVDALKKNREELMKKSMPFMEKALGIYEMGGVKEADKMNYNNTIVALTKMYDIMNMKVQKEAIAKKPKG
jgi:tetratricopeptide (TPR) repeat protein